MPRRHSQKNLPEGGQFALPAKPFTLKQLVAAVKETIANPQTVPPVSAQQARIPRIRRLVIAAPYARE